jgi:Protein kinase domain/zinc-ribbon domain
VIQSPLFMRCVSCSSEVPDASRFCPACGAPVDSNAQATLVDDNLLGAEGETIAPPSTPPRSPSHPAPPSHRSSRSSSGAAAFLSSSDALGGGRFAPGQMIAERYRVVALAGRGGMGEVYRAEDLRLSQIVAIKFLPARLSQDAGALARFHSEVRIARQVSHPNVCRVFDIGDADGVPFLTMEYVDGEDLASLIRRIGRLSTDKAIEIARQVCAGLAAAHERGVIHRDLKPANLMLDGSGKIRITDFGLASVAATIEAADVRAGTPAYMAPEQLEGKEVTAKSDLYSLGLVLYEILTGKRAFDASTLPELMKQREKSAPASPSSVVRDLDPVVERVILRCLEHDPAQRPASALQVAAALPGGDPLAAALAAGETPSPEMVAAAGQTEGMRPIIAATLLALSSIGLLLLLFASDRFKLHNIAPLDNAPEVLATHARQVIRQLGYTEPYADEAFSFSLHGDYLDYLQDHDKSPDRWNALANGRPASVVFWYRQSPRLLRPQSFFSSIGDGSITTFDPPMHISGMVLIVLDMQGRLLHFEAVPPQKDTSEDRVTPPNWPALLVAAGVDPSAYHSVPPEWTPLVWGDSRAAWMGTMAGKISILERIEAAAYRGRPVYFDMIYPWTTPDRAGPVVNKAHDRISIAILLVLFLAVTVSGLYVARRNVLLKRSDSRGAARLGVVVFLIFAVMWTLNAHHVGSIDEFDTILLALGWALPITTLATVMYLALEPYVRRYDPHTLISWTRLLAGHLRDPLVGRDILIGTCYGVLLTLFEMSDNLLLPLFGKPRPVPGGIDPHNLLGVRPALGGLLFYILAFLLYSLLIFFFLFLLRLVFKRDWIAATILVLIAAGTNSPGEYPVLNYFLLGIIWISIVLILKKVGVLALVVGLVVQNVLVVFPMTSHLSRWYASAGLTGIVVIAALLAYGFVTGLAGRPLFTVAALDR